MKNLLFGLAFASLWASASVATKFGLMSAQPFVVADFRFFIAGILMLAWSMIVDKSRMPNAQEWKPLLIYGVLNVGIYLGCFVLAMAEVSAGIGSLGIAVNPLIISVLTAFWLGRKVKKQEYLGLFLGLLGVGIATFPLLVNSHASVKGIGILAISMLAYSVATVYYSSVNWQLPRMSINAWQVLFGGIFLLPLTYFYYQPSLNHFDSRFYLSVTWLVFPVSIAAVQLWLYLLKIDAVKASLWLYLCPIFGFLYAYLFLSEPITLYTYIGTFFVILGLYLAKRQ